ncbi:Hsp20/alpha crystallin family protein [uncultured Thiohalocapsa sp.]|uniref:Hsp20/alpha crystallin family protein n=1 Tax=uncultured Thiohalocapsa sp. TaxID=768990 RepID=UPI0025DC7FFE|nr:Hsp20/alpha crystallin family protein [uncultured Thiohalocapsa sp.]
MAKDIEQTTESKPAATPRAMTPWEQMERFMDDLMPGRWMQRWGGPAWADLLEGLQAPAPSVDVIDRDDAVVVKAEIPGVRKEDVEISLTENTLTLRGESRHEDKQDEGSFHRREIRRGAFSRVITLPAAVDTDKATAKFEDGMLVVSMPKVTKTSRKRVEIA